MKIIISHDIDHINAWEHYKDLIIPKFIIRNTFELFTGVITLKEFLLRKKSLITNKWQNIDELIQFNKQNNIPATFFIGVNNGMYLSYPLTKATFWCKKIINSGFDVGVHGIAYSNLNKIKEEFEIFKKISQKNKFGIRMHYLRNDLKTIENLSEAGYFFDTTIHKDKESPYKINQIWEFPLHIMEGDIFYQGRNTETKSLDVIKNSTLNIVDSYAKKNIPYLTILFHDRYFDNSYAKWKEWYIWLINYFMKNNYEFISYTEAVNELESKKNISNQK